MTPPLLQLDAISQRYARQTVVDQLSFSLQRGEIGCLLGGSGCGKTTVLRCIAGFETLSAGRIVLDGQLLADTRLHTPAHTRQIGMVFQDYGLFPHLTVAGNIGFGLSALARDEQAQRVSDMLALVGLTGLADSYPHELSGGQQQRVALARALAADPSILLMDEAFSALDPIIRTEMQSELMRLQQVKRRTIVFISHDLDEAMRIGDRIAIMKDGQVVQVGTPDDILRNPANDYVRSFIRGVDAAAVFKASDIARKPLTVVAEHADRGSRAALKMLQDQDREYAYVVSPAQQFLGVVSAESLRSALAGHQGPLGLAHAYLPAVQPIVADEPVSELFGRVASAPFAMPVVQPDGRFGGAISKTTLLKFLDRDTPPVPPSQPALASAQMH